jgi:hypothetical protein
MPPRIEPYPLPTSLKDGKVFFENLKAAQQAHSYHPELILNVDEFFCSLSETAKWTWERIPVGGKKNIMIKQDKLGFTCSILSNLAGEVLCLQMIWKGKTSESHARVVDPHPKIMQQHREDSHFQSEHTWQQYLRRLETVLSPVRQRLAVDGVLPPALLLIDAAPQHTAVPDGLRGWLHTCNIPPKMTHVFQPADQFIIANLKQYSVSAYERWIEEVVSVYDEDVAVGILAGSPPPRDSSGKSPAWTQAGYRRAKKYTCLAKAMDAMDAGTVLRSWNKSGIPRAMGFPPTSDTTVLYDDYVALVEELEMQDALHEGGMVGAFEDEEGSPPLPTPLPGGIPLGPAQVGKVKKSGPGRPKKIFVPAPGQQLLTQWAKRPREEETPTDDNEVVELQLAEEVDQ